jgi:hypothetical protein
MRHDIPIVNWDMQAGCGVWLRAPAHERGTCAALHEYYHNHFSTS